MGRGPSLTVQVLGDTAIRRRLLRWAEGASDASSTMRRIGERLRWAAEQQFASDGSWGGAPWARLADSTIARKVRLGQDLRILRATHRLMDSLTRESSAEHIEDIGPDHIHFGTSVPYVVYHKRTRPPLRLPEWFRRELTRELQSGVLERAGR